MQSFTLGWFSSANTGAPASDYAASVNFNDGTAPAAAVVTALGNGTFNVSLSHTFRRFGQYPAAITVVQGGNSLYGTSLVQVSNAPITATFDSGISINQGQPFSGELVKLLDGNPLAAISDYWVLVDWGDGSAVTQATVTNTGPTNAGGSSFSISATHTYAPGPLLRPVAVAIYDAAGREAFLNGYIRVLPVTTILHTNDTTNLAGTPAADNLTIFDGAGNARFTLQPYLGSQIGLRAATGDINGDGVPDIITVPGPGGGPDFRVYNGIDGSLLTTFHGDYDTGLRTGFFVAAGKTTGAATAQVLIGEDFGDTPHTELIGQTPTGLDVWFAFTPVGYTNNFIGGVRVAMADINGDGFADLLVSPGPSIYGGTTPTALSLPTDYYNGRTGQLLNSFFAFGSSYVWGSTIGAGDMNGSGSNVVILGQDVGGLVKLLVTPSATQIGAFSPMDALGRSLRATTFDYNGDGISDMVFTWKRGTARVMKVFSGASGLVLVNTTF